MNRSQFSPYVGGALLRLCLDRSLWLGRKLKYRCSLTFPQLRQQNDVPIWKFERIVVPKGIVLVHLSKDGCRMG